MEILGVTLVKKTYEAEIARLKTVLQDKQEHLRRAEDRSDRFSDELASAKQTIEELEYAYGALLLEHTALLKEKGD